MKYIFPLLLLFLTSIFSFANSEEEIRLEDRINAVHPNALIVIKDLEFSHMPFLALTGFENSRNLLGKAKERADKICVYLNYKKGALSYYLGLGNSDNFNVIENDTLNLMYIGDYEFFRRVYLPSSFREIRCIAN